MGLTRQQRLGGIVNDVAWLTWRERLVVLWALRPWHYSTDEHGRKWLGRN